MLIGVDMSAAELELGSRLRGHNVELLERRAQNLRLAEHSVDAVVCHLAFMLMSPLEPVVEEIAHALRPGGLLAAVINRAPVAGPADNDNDDVILAVSRRQIGAFLAREYPHMGMPHTGDPRVGSLEGLGELFSSGSGYQDELEVRDFDLLIETSPKGIADFLLSTYLLGALPVEKQVQLRAEIEPSLDIYRSDEGMLRMAFLMWMILARTVAHGRGSSTEGA